MRRHGDEVVGALAQRVLQVGDADAADGEFGGGFSRAEENV